MYLPLGKLDHACHDGPTALNILDFKREPFLPGHRPGAPVPSNPEV